MQKLHNAQENCRISGWYQIVIHKAAFEHSRHLVVRHGRGHELACGWKGCRGWVLLLLLLLVRCEVYEQLCLDILYIWLWDLGQGLQEHLVGKGCRGRVRLLFLGCEDMNICLCTAKQDDASQNQKLPELFSLVADAEHGRNHLVGKKIFFICHVHKELIPNCDTQGSIWTFPTFGCQTWERSWTSMWLERMQRLGPVAVVVAGEVWSLWTALFGHSLHLVMRFGTGPSRAFGWKRLQRSSPVVVPGMWRYEHLSMYCKARWCIAKPEAAGTFFSGGRRRAW